MTKRNTIIEEKKIFYISSGSESIFVFLHMQCSDLQMCNINLHEANWIIINTHVRAESVSII